MNIRLLYKAWRAWARGEKKGRKLMDKPLKNSVTIIGAILYGVMDIVKVFAEAMTTNGSLPDWKMTLPGILQTIALVVAIIGGRAAIGKAIVAGNGKTRTP